MFMQRDTKKEGCVLRPQSGIHRSHLFLTDARSRRRSLQRFSHPLLSSLHFTSFPPLDSIQNYRAAVPLHSCCSPPSLRLSLTARDLSPLCFSHLFAALSPVRSDTFLWRTTRGGGENQVEADMIHMPVQLCWRRRAPEAARRTLSPGCWRLAREAAQEEEEEEEKVVVEKEEDGQKWRTCILNKLLRKKRERRERVGITGERER